MAFPLCVLTPLSTLKVTAEEVRGQAHGNELAVDGLLKQEAE